MGKSTIISLVIITLAFFLIIRAIKIKEIIDVLSGASITIILIAVLLGFIIMLIWCAAWKISLENIHKVSYLKILPVLFAGAFGNVITPGARVGGFPLKAYYLNGIYHGSMSKYMGSSIYDAVVSFLSFLVFVVAAVLYALNRHYADINPFLILLGLVFLIILTVIVLWAYILNKNTKKRKKLRKLKNKSTLCEKISDSLSKCYSTFLMNFNLKTFLGSMLVHGAKWVVVILRNYCVFIALGWDIMFFDVFMIVCFTNFIAYISAIPGGVGITEFSMIKLYSLIGIPVGIATAVAIIDRAIYYFYAVFIGYCANIWLQLSITNTGRKSKHF